VFKSLRIPQVLDRRVSEADLPESYHSRIALIGCGPASISCATYLARLGYSDITVFEKRQYVGGLRYKLFAVAYRQGKQLAAQSPPISFFL